MPPVPLLELGPVLASITNPRPRMPPAVEMTSTRPAVALSTGKPALAWMAAMGGVKAAAGGIAGSGSFGLAVSLPVPSRMLMLPRATISTQPRPSEPPVADTWRDTLLKLSLELPIDAGVQELTERFLDGLYELLPHLALGACVVAEPGERPIVSVRLPPGTSDALQRDPSRLFPLLTAERIFSIDASSTFHIGSGHGGFSPLDLQLAERAAVILESALAKAHAFRRALHSSRALERLQARMVQAEKLASLGQIAAGVVHELNNPLTSILAYAESLVNKAKKRPPSPDVEDDLERLRRIEEAAGRILKFSRDLVAYARPSAEVPAPLRLGDVVDKALAFCEHEFRNVSVVREIPPTLPAVRGVAGALTQVFVNLFTNAAHAMAETGGELRLVAEHDPSAGAVLFDVIDNGGGVDPQDLPRIFEPFFTTKTDGRGTGLGLSIVHGILDTHGGTIAARSTVGEGTVFTLTLPISGTGSLPPRG